jgi:hypothetical protein
LGRARAERELTRARAIIAIATASAVGRSNLLAAANEDDRTFTAKVFLTTPETGANAPPPYISIGISDREELFGDYAAVKLKIVPAPQLPPEVVWHVSNPKFVVTDHSSTSVLGGSTLPGYTFPDSTGTFVHTVEQQLVATLSAQVGNPYNVRLTIPVYAAPRLTLGCYVPYRSARSVASPSAYVGIPEADVFLSPKPFEPGVNATECDPVNPVDEKSQFIIFPGGRVLLDQALQTVRPEQWSAATRSLTFGELVGKTLLFKALSGRLVKTTYGGPMLFATEDNSHFPDERLPAPEASASVNLRD